MGISFPDRRVAASSGSATPSASARSFDVREDRSVALDATPITSRTGGPTRPRCRAVTGPRRASTPTAQRRSPGQDGRPRDSTLVRMAAPVAPPGAAGPGPGGRHARDPAPGAGRHAAPDDAAPVPVDPTAGPRRRRAVPDVGDVPDAPTVREPWPLAASDALTLAAATTLLPGAPAAPTSRTGRPAVPPPAVRPVAPPPQPPSQPPSQQPPPPAPSGSRPLLAPPTVPPPGGPDAPTRTPVPAPAAGRRAPIRRERIPGTPVVGARPVWGPPQPAR
jgi:hypothetical protein